MKTLLECVTDALRSAGIQDAGAVKVEYQNGVTVEFHSPTDARLSESVDPRTIKQVSSVSTASAGL